MNPFQLKTQLHNGALIVTTEGYINQSAGEQIASVCEKYIDEGGKTVILDLKLSKIINSVGISHIIEIIDNLNQIGGKLFFSNLDSAVEKTLTIMGIFQIAQRVDSVDAVFGKKSFKLN